MSNDETVMRVRAFVLSYVQETWWQFAFHNTAMIAPQLDLSVEEYKAGLAAVQAEAAHGTVYREAISTLPLEEPPSTVH